MASGIRERIVINLIKERANWVIGGYENSVSDGHMTEMPSAEEIKSEVYGEVIRSKHVEIGGGLIGVSKDIRFLGKDFIEAKISRIVDRILSE